MAQREREGSNENPVNPDASRLLLVDPEDLLKDNSAALIVNEVTYRSMKAHFSEDRFTRFPPEVAWVEVYTPEGVKEKLLVIDGLTRAGFARDNKGKVLKEAPDFRFDQIQVFDITKDALQDPQVVPSEERRPDKRALTTQQYLRAIVPHTMVHSEIAPDRIAGLLCNAWLGKVGPDLADRFPAVAALGFLANKKNSISTDRELQKTLASQDKLVINEQSEERDRLNQALRETAAIIRQANLLFQVNEVEEAAYVLIGSGSAVIGGTKEARRQIHGLLKSIAFESKLTKEFRMQLGQAENVRLEYARALEGAFKRFSDGSPTSESERKEIKRTLDDDSLTIRQTLQIVTAQSPMQERDRLVKALNKQALKQHYQKVVTRQNLTEREQTLIDNLGSQTSLLESSIPGLVRDIQYTVAILRQSEEWHRHLEEEANDLIKQGVNLVTINNARAQMSRYQQAVLAAQSEDALASRAKTLHKIVDQFQQTVAEEKLKHNVEIAVDKAFSQELNTTQDPRSKDRLIWAVLHAKDLDRSNPSDINKWLSSLKRLDADLQTEIMAGTIEIAVALRIQRRRLVIETTPPAEAVRPSTVIERAAPQIPRVEPSPQNQITQEEIRQRRIERGNERLRTEVIEQHLMPAIRVLATIDLSPEEIQVYLKKMLGEAEIAIEKQRGGHPDIVRVIDKDYPHLLEEVTRLREIIINLERRQSTDGTHRDRQ